MGPELSIVSPFYNEEKGIALFFETLIPIIESEVSDYEIICIDDGSIDSTYKLLKEWHARNEKIKVLKLSRNFGKEAALTAGLDYASGKAVIPLDTDLQDPPQLIPQMLKKWREGYKVVEMTRCSRDEGFLKNTTASWFYKLINACSEIPISGNTGDFRLMDRKVVDAIKQLPERNRFMKGILAWPGFEKTIIYFARPERAAGIPKQNYKKLFGLAFNGLFAFSMLPIRIWATVGFFISFISLLYGIIIISRTLFLGRDVPGYASIVTIVLFLGGIQLISLGVMGEYIGRIYNETKQRPIYIIEEEIK